MPALSLDAFRTLSLRRVLAISALVLINVWIASMITDDWTHGRLPNSCILEDNAMLGFFEADPTRPLAVMGLAFVASLLTRRAWILALPILIEAARVTAAWIHC